MSLYFTNPVARPAIWGGDRLARRFGYRDMTDHIGQAWAFSCQKGSESPLRDGSGTLAGLWRERPALFRSRYAEFPFIISLVAPVEDLSIQIHPGAALARRDGYPSGKNEAWSFLQGPESGTIVYGQKAADAAELAGMVAADRWDALIGRLPVKTGDFVYVPAGMVHALTAGCVAYEIQQATDVTYRFYDYHRRDAQGRERPLHVEKAMECVDFSLGTQNAAPPAQTVELPGVAMTAYLQNESFCVRRLAFHGEQTLRFSGYQLMTVADGEGTANGAPVGVGDNFLLPAGEPLTVRGRVTLMTTCE